MSAQLRAIVSANMCELGPMETRLMADVSTRLLMGQKKYGKLRKRKKNWKRELYEELLDGIVYAAMEVIENAD